MLDIVTMVFESTSMRYETRVARFWLRVRRVPQSSYRRQSRDKRQELWGRECPWSLWQGWITCAHVRDLMARAAANSLGTITNLEKMAAFLKVSYGARFVVKKESQTENGRKKFLH